MKKINICLLILALVVGVIPANSVFASGYDDIRLSAANSYIAADAANSSALGTAALGMDPIIITPSPEDYYLVPAEGGIYKVTHSANRNADIYYSQPWMIDRFDNGLEATFRISPNTGIAARDGSVRVQVGEKIVELIHFLQCGQQASYEVNLPINGGSSKITLPPSYKYYQYGSLACSSRPSWISALTVLQNGSSDPSITISAGSTITSRSGTIAITIGNKRDGTFQIANINVIQTKPTTGRLTIKYDWMGGSEPTEIAVVPPSLYKDPSGTTTFKLKGAGTKSGYVFAGWKNITKGSMNYLAFYPAGASVSWKSSSITLDETITFEAQWKAVAKVTITYNANEGSGAPPSQSVAPNETVYLSSTVPTRTGYTFQGWAKTSTATTVSYSPGSSFSTASNVTLYAVWVKNITISYNANGGTGAPPSQSVVPNETVYLSSTVPTRTGYTFQGWSKSSTATTPSYSPGSSFSTASSVTLYAVWVKNVTISYNANGGSGAPPSQSVAPNTTVNLSSIMPTRTGYTFQGWAKSSTATTPSYSPGSSFSTASSVTLYTVWKKNVANVTITYNANGGSGAPPSQSVAPNTTVNLSSIMPTRTGYTFQGWAKTNTATTQSYSPGSSFSTASSVTLYAVWVKNITISYNANGGSGAPPSQSVAPNTIVTISSSTKPTRPGYTFQGWAKTSTGSVAYQPGTAFKATTSVTLYAVWKK